MVALSPATWLSDRYTMHIRYPPDSSAANLLRPLLLYLSLVSSNHIDSPSSDDGLHYNTAPNSNPQVVGCDWSRLRVCPALTRVRHVSLADIWAIGCRVFIHSVSYQYATFSSSFFLPFFSFVRSLISFRLLPPVESYIQYGSAARHSLLCLLRCEPIPILYGSDISNCANTACTYLTVCLQQPY